MKTTLLAASVAALLGCALACGPALAEGQYRNPDNTNPKDKGEGTYPVPYKKPVVAEVTAQLKAIRAHMDATTPTRIISKRTKQPITDLKTPNADAIFEPSDGDYGIQVYEMGVVHSGLLKAAEATGDQSFTAMTQRHFGFFAQTLPYFRAQEQKFHLERANSFSRFLDPRSLDDSGSMCAALIRARLAKVGPDLKAMIDTCSDWVINKQFRLGDGTMARKRPQEVSLWADDMYMSIPALAEMGRLTGNRKHFDDAVNNVMGMSSRMFNAELGLYTHGWHANLPDAPRFYWARANGWAVLAMSDLLDVLPKDHPGYPKVLAQLRASIKGIAERQSGSGLWHQMLDRNDSYLETSASAMFTYVIAHAVNQGWVSPTTYGSIAQAGWAGLSTRITAKGQVEGTCVGTTLAGDMVYYYHRPTSAEALHGYGPTLMAGAEIIKLVTNPAFEVQHKVRTYHYMPKGGQTDYREHH
ncbi:glycoside hydrolase family 88/105 protein [Massilia yuzhufengensis]|uniref:Rhamnogalacturonyl hydrolase YesR n=1 Tax=Massilia yuzhufengensis TaxID=1164594 RepID=A0A1I1REB4_9BURK|nr:glycoside hydrolase family 88 protein [Massilia yuzhufengensis]SFD32635.1 Rhamnogalacturonyl hydrolase YesR [Massilia yuzhufengensis]